MKKLLFTIAAVCLVASVGYCQEKIQPLQLSIKSDKQVYEVGNRVRINFLLKNISDKTMRFYPRVPQDIVVQKTDGTPCPSESYQLMEGPGQEVSLKPGEEWPYGFTGYILKDKFFTASNIPGSQKIGTAKMKGSGYEAEGVFISFPAESNSFFSPNGSYFLERDDKYIITMTLCSWKEPLPAMSVDTPDEIKAHAEANWKNHYWQGCLTSNTITIEVKEEKTHA